MVAALLCMLTDYVECLLDLLRDALLSPDHNDEGWYAYELCEGLANLAHDEQNRSLVVCGDLHSHFVRDLPLQVHFIMYVMYVNMSTCSYGR